MFANKENLRDRFPSVVKDTRMAIDLFVCVFFWMLMETWANDEQIKAQALSLLEQHRPALADDVTNKGPLTIWVKGTWHKQSGYLA